MRPQFIAPILLVLAGCAATTPATEAILGSEQLRTVVAANRAKYWKDPDSIRDASISRSFACYGGLAHVVAPPNVCICVEANAKNSLGGYTGLKRTTFMFHDLTLVDALPPRSQDACDPMSPFPELNSGYQAPVAAAPAATRRK
jgi:hypothetical protein